MELSSVALDTGVVAAHDTRLVQQERRRARNCHELTELFNERGDLRGVSPAADFVAEAVRWSA